MHIHTTITPRAMGLALAGLLLCASLACAKPPLSAEVARLLENGGVDAARERFAELWANSAADYEADAEGLADLGTRYLEAGNIEAGMAVMEMVSIVSLAELDTALESQAEMVAEMEAAAAQLAADASAETEVALLALPAGFVVQLDCRRIDVEGNAKDTLLAGQPAKAPRISSQVPNHSGLDLADKALQDLTLVLHGAVIVVGIFIIGCPFRASCFPAQLFGG
ncbi:MAG: hypothetical protein R6W80_16995 [Haliea sp.]